MNYNEACDGISKAAKMAGYVALNIDYHGNIRGPGRYVASAKSPNANNVRVTLASTGSYLNMYREAREYLETI
uniref:Uncharacterized protein n=1 Tax=viral metagenome TaxID=1070528 RepID=A0A6M3JZZ2_9ZZZZ